MSFCCPNTARVGQAYPEKEILLRAGEPVPLTPKTFQVLLVLVRNSQEVVAKDDLMKAVWPDTFVDEANLSRNIFMLRKVLGDSSQDHRYIVTVPGRGYRLAEDVRLVPEREFSIVAASRSTVQVHIKETKPWAWILAIMAVLLAVAGGTLRSIRRKPVLSEKDTVVLADFANATGDPVFDDTLRQGIAVQLEQSPRINLLSEERIRRTLEMMGRPADTRLTQATAQEICQRTGSAAVLDGSIASIGTHYVLGLRAKNCRSGDVLDEEQAQAARKEDVLNALGQIASKFRARIGESLNTVEERNTPLAEATTPSLEALKAYSTGWKVGRSAGDAAAIPFFKRAVEIDPNFAMANAALGLMYGSTGETALAAESTRRAYELRDRASEKEKFFIDAYYDGRATGNQEKAQQTCEAWAQAYPREVLPHAFLSGFIYPATGKYEKSVEAAQRAIEIDPDAAFAYVNLGYSYVYLYRLGDAENALRRAADRKLENPFFLLLRFDMAFLKGDKAGMDREAALATGKSGAEDWITDHEASVLAYFGRLQESRRKSQNAAELAEQTAHRERAALFEAGAAVREGLFGNARAAKRTAVAALALTNAREVEYGAALASALSGDSSTSQRLASDLEIRFPEDTSVKFSYLPTVRAQLALDRGEPAKAIKILQIALPYELSAPRSSLQGFFGALYPIYVRGEAYLAEGKGVEAAAEFRKILDHRGIVIVDPIGALASLQLGRAYVLSGNRSTGKSAYQDFFTLWKNADPNVPILKQARSEYAALR